MPIAVEEDHFRVAMMDPLNLAAIQDIQFASSQRLIVNVASASDIEWAIDHHFRLEVSIDNLVRDMGTPTRIEVLERDDTQDDVTDRRTQGQAAPIIRIVNEIISSALDCSASDIHIEPRKTSLVVRNRVDGHLRVTSQLPKWVQGAVTSRIKIMAHLDITEKRRPQDGRVAVRVGRNNVDLRVSALPSSFGEKIVIRLLRSDTGPVTIGGLGFDERTGDRFRALVARPQGILLVTGPTGSGKSTTLYAALSHINSEDRNITTIEDPVEYELDGITQVGIDEKAGRTFSTVLRSLLRQDPDVIMVGEMRDAETATIAMQAALTGHLVLSTLHTNNTTATLTRLRDLGIPSYLVASTINGIIAQRLVRVICETCRASASPSDTELARIGLVGVGAGQMFYRGKGCGDCGGTGYKGRTAIYEILTMSPKLRDLVAADAPEAALRQLALSEGMSTLALSGLEKVSSGVTTVEEVIRVIESDDDLGGVCAQCGAALSPDFLACPQCGVATGCTCGSCQAVVDGGWTFCPYCTNALDGSETDRMRVVGEE
jgi:type IV pilus assembly protein PilB